MFRRAILGLRSLAAATLMLALAPMGLQPSFAADPPNMEELLQVHLVLDMVEKVMDILKDVMNDNNLDLLMLLN